MAKLLLILGVVAIALVLCLRVAGVITLDVMTDSLGRSLGILGVLSLAASAIGFIAGKRPNKDQSSNQGPGPKF